MQAIQDLKDEIQRDLTGFVPPGQLVPRDVHKNLQDTLDIIDGVEGRVGTLEETVETLGDVPGPSDTSLDNGGNVRWLQDYDFRVSAAAYTILGTSHTSPQTDVALDAAHATLPRIDVIALDDQGDVVVIKGDEDANPSKPLVDPSTQLELTFIYVAAGTTQPASASAVTIYDENLSVPDEWNVYSDHASVITNSTTAQTGSVGIEGTNCPVEPWLFEMSANDDTLIIADNSWNLGFSIKSKASWGTGNNAKRLIITVLDWDSGDPIGTPVILKARTTYGFDSSNIADWQQVTIPLADFGMVPGRKISAFRVGAAGSSGTLGFYIDGIILTGNGVAQSSPANSSFSAVPVSTEGTGATNTIQERSNGEIWAVDKDGSAVQLESAPEDFTRANKILSGGQVAWTMVGYDFRVSKCVFMVHGFTYTAPQTNVSLATPDPTNPRIDVIVARDNNTIQVRQGTPNVSPQKPNTDTSIEVELGTIYVEAASSQPRDYALRLIFDEDLGTGGGEYDFSSYDPSIVIEDLGAGNGFNGGQYAIRFNNTPTGNWMADLWDISNFGFYGNQHLVLNIKSLGSWGAGKDAKKLVVFFADYDSGNVITSSVAIGDGAYGFDSSNTTDWQQVAIPLHHFNIGQNSHNAGAIGFSVAGENGNLNAYVDYIFLSNVEAGSSPYDAKEFRVLYMPSTELNRSALNSIQELSDGNVHAIDKNGSSVLLKSAATGGETIITSLLPYEGGDGAGTFATPNELRVPLPAGQITLFEQEFNMGYASSDFQLTYGLQIDTNGQGAPSVLYDIVVEYYPFLSGLLEAGPIIVHRWADWNGLVWGATKTLDTVVGYQNSDGGRFKIKGRIYNNMAGACTYEFTFRTYEGLSFAQLSILPLLTSKYNSAAPTVTP